MSEMYKCYINWCSLVMSIFVDLRPIIQHNKVTCDFKKNPIAGGMYFKRTQDDAKRFIH
jgi:hypothetical protein